MLWDQGLGSIEVLEFYVVKKAVRGLAIITIVTWKAFWNGRYDLFHSHLRIQ